MDQYRNDRLPYDAKTKRREPLLTFKRGAVVHFAMSDSEIMMATKLDGENTFSCRSIRGARTKVARYMRVTRRVRLRPMVPGIPGSLLLGGGLPAGCTAADFP